MYCRLQPHAPILQPYALWLQPCAHSPATQCIPGLQPCASQACNPVRPRPATLCVPGLQPCASQACNPVRPRCIEAPLHEHHCGRALLRHVVLYFHPSDGKQ